MFWAEEPWNRGPLWGREKGAQHQAGLSLLHPQDVWAQS